MSLLEWLAIGEEILRNMTDAELAAVGFDVTAAQLATMDRRQQYEAVQRADWNCVRHCVKATQTLAIMIGVDPMLDVVNYNPQIRQRQDAVIARLRNMTDAELAAAGIPLTAAQIAEVAVDTFTDRVKLIVALEAAAS